MSAAQRETLDIDVLFVGAGPASLAGAYHLGRLLAEHNRNAAAADRLEPSIAVLEKGAEIGSHALSGAVLDPSSLRELFRDRWQQAPLEAEVGGERVLFLTERRAFALPIVPPPLQNHGCHVVSLGKLVKWMAQQVEGLGIDLFCEFPAREVLIEGERVIGVRTGDRGLDKQGQPKANFEPGVDIHSQVVVFGEGPRGTLAKQLEARFDLAAGKNPQVYAIGLKELWELPAGRVKPGDVIHTMGWPLGNQVYGGGFVYGMKDDLLIVGLVVGLDYENPLLDPHLEFQRFKTHPEMARLLGGGKLINYGAKAIPEGGWWSMPRPYGNGFLLIGDSAGLVNGQRLKGIHLAIRSGMLAAETIFAALRAGDTSAASLAAYEQAIAGDWMRDELWKVRNFHQGFHHGLAAGIAQGALGFLTRGRGWGLFDRLATGAGHARLRRLDEPGRAELLPGRPVAYDGQLTFDRLADVYLSGAAHAEDQPVHLQVADTSICVDRCAREFANPCQRFCPAGVYEIVAEPTHPSGRRLLINASNCVHCKTCDVMDPYQIITWVPPEGGGGPSYGRM